MGRPKSKEQRTAKELPKLIAIAESFGEYASMCFAGGRRNV
jgi:murein endopeptidase